MVSTKQAARLRAVVSRLLKTPILIEGDARELLDVLRQGARESNIPLTTLETAEAPAQVVILALERDGRRSSFTKASRMLRAVDHVVAPDAVRLVVMQSERSRIAPDKLQNLLAAELLYQVALALPGLLPRRGWRSFRERAGHAALDAAGLRVLRFA
ncbi:hypothetical protein ACFSBZ_01515 [Amnibacterium flavum]|uniref:Uncharacterized protein n=1 Tax=Amnibacterium flavum TaxID=2173173 RepID=A0A2V1HQ73_9MICO|nr:hypothetical protein [Amnibacterium flavum]PVZ94766.1 hypothetical protein DDQ50_13910 [Amnibacterium flavum]